MATQRKAHGLTILNSSHKDVMRLKRDGHVAEIHGNRFWNSSFLLMEYLSRHPLKRNTRVLEIGCGWGLLGMFCARHFGARVTGIDADAAVGPYLDLHAGINNVKMKFERKRFAQLSVAYLQDFDVIIGADICFWDELSDELFNMTRRARRAGTRQVMISDPSRSPFTNLAERCESAFDDVTLIDKRISRPVRASGEILIVRTNPQAPGTKT